MTTYNIAFDPSEYREVAGRAAKYYQAKAMGSGIPVIKTAIKDAYTYRYTHLGDPIASSAGIDWSPEGVKGRVLHQYTDYDLYTEQMFLHFDLNEYNKYGEQLIADKKGAIIDKWGLNVDYADWHGPHAGYGASTAAAGSGTQLVEGLIGQLTSIQNLDGTDSLLSVKGDIWYALNTMIDAGANLVNMSYWGLPGTNNWAHWSPMQTSTASHDELFNAALGKDILIAPYIESFTATDDYEGFIFADDFL